MKKRSLSLAMTMFLLTSFNAFGNANVLNVNEVLDNAPIHGTSISRKDIQNYVDNNPLYADSFIIEEGPKMQFNAEIHDQEFFEVMDGSMLSSMYYTYQDAEDDKKKHFLVGTVVGGTAMTVAKLYFKNDENSDLKAFIAGTSAALLAGLLKEAYDATGRGNVDAMDAVYTAVPGAALSFKLSFPF